jgi:uncharacterized membrane-anchored protein YjiN (DUF445 family)
VHFPQVTPTAEPPRPPRREVVVGLGVGSMDPQARARDLRRMKTLATSLLLFATAVFLAARWGEVDGVGLWISYVRAAAEAAMVGALADWFAVTALFRRPLGLPIPHTAIIPTKKDVIGDSLGDFIGDNFLAEHVVRDKLDRARIPARLGEWVAEPANAERVTAELATLARGLVTVLRDDDVQAVIENVLVRKLMEQPVGPVMGVLLEGIVKDGTHHRTVDLITDRVYDWVGANQGMVLRIVHERAPGWTPRFVDDMIADRVFFEVAEFVWAVKTDQGHPLRIALDRFLGEFATDLQHDPRTMARVDRIKQQFVEHEDVQYLIRHAWDMLKTIVLDAAQDPSSELRRRVRDGLIGFGSRLGDDPELLAKIDGWVGDAAGYVVRHYSREITTLVTDTVARWDAEETSRKIELQVGRDLQFIRINGTVVGALAGLAIFAVSHALFGV